MHVAVPSTKTTYCAHCGYKMEEDREFPKKFYNASEKHWYKDELGACRFCQPQFKVKRCAACLTGVGVHTK